MKKLRIADMTMAEASAIPGASLTFREKTEIARSLDTMCADVIELPAIVDEKADSLLVRTVAPLLSRATVSLPATYTRESIDIAWAALSAAKNPRLSIALPLSAAQMEFICHKKPKALLEMLPDTVAYARTLCSDVEFRAIDATRAEYAFLCQAIAAAIDAGATVVTVCDTASVLLPTETADFVTTLRRDVPALAGITLGIECRNGLGVALASAAAAAAAGADEIKLACAADALPSEEALCALLQSRGDTLGVACDLRAAEIHRITRKIERLTVGKRDIETLTPKKEEPSLLDATATVADIAGAIRRLGYDLTEEDTARVHEAFTQIAAKKPITAAELEAIVATTALQVPSTYKLKSYVINNGNLMPATAQIQLEKAGELLSGVCIGDGPIDAAFRAIEQIIGHHYELDEFRIQAVTEGREAMGSALVRLRSAGQLYSGNGVSTDIIGASIRAYLSALNKIVYEEN